MAAVQGGRGQKPVAVKMALADKVTGMTAALSIVSALHAARNRGVGQYIRIPMVEAMMSFAANDTMVGYAFVPDDEYKDQTPKNGSLDPFRTKDGYVTIAPYHRPAMGASAGRRRSSRMVANRGSTRASTHLPQRDCTGLSRAGQRALAEGARRSGLSRAVRSTTTTPSSTIPKSSPTRAFTVYEHPVAGTVRSVNPGMRFQRNARAHMANPAALGEHTEEILREAGITREQIEEMRKGKVIN